jgi:hypothetical protein
MIEQNWRALGNLGKLKWQNEREAEDEFGFTVCVVESEQGCHRDSPS